MSETEPNNYAGFWIRLGAHVIDFVLLLLLIIPLLIAAYGLDSIAPGKTAGGILDILMTVALSIVVIVFWAYRSATPGKIVFHLKIVDAKTGGVLSTRQMIGRVLAYNLLVVGFLSVALNKQKRGWHDRLAGTVVIKARKTSPSCEK